MKSLAILLAATAAGAPLALGYEVQEEKVCDQDAQEECCAEETKGEAPACEAAVIQEAVAQLDAAAQALDTAACQASAEAALADAVACEADARASQQEAIALLEAAGVVSVQHAQASRLEHASFARQDAERAALEAKLKGLEAALQALTAEIAEGSEDGEGFEFSFDGNELTEDSFFGGVDLSEFDFEDMEFDFEDFDFSNLETLGEDIADLFADGQFVMDLSKGDENDHGKWKVFSGGDEDGHGQWRVFSGSNEDGHGDGHGGIHVFPTPTEGHGKGHFFSKGDTIVVPGGKHKVRIVHPKGGKIRIGTAGQDDSCCSGSTSSSSSSGGFAVAAPRAPRAPRAARAPRASQAPRGFAIGHAPQAVHGHDAGDVRELTELLREMRGEMRELRGEMHELRNEVRRLRKTNRDS